MMGDRTMRSLVTRSPSHSFLLQYRSLIICCVLEWKQVSSWTRVNPHLSLKTAMRQLFRIDTRGSVLMFICSRESGRDAVLTEKHRKHRATVERILRSGQILGQLKNATYVQAHLKNYPLMRAFPISRKRFRKGSGIYEIHSSLRDTEKGTQIIFVSLGIDGISCNQLGWQTFINKFQNKGPRQLEFYILFVEFRKQWNNSVIKWSTDDWFGPIEELYWTFCPLKDMLYETEIRLHRQIQEQWTKCGDGRERMSEGRRVQERPPEGRSGPKLTRYV